MSRPTSYTGSDGTIHAGRDRGLGSPDPEKQHGSSPEPSGPTGPPGPPGGPKMGELYAPKTVKFWLVMTCNFLALFLVALDRTIISTAIPRITDEFHSLGDIGWYGSAYMLTTSASQLVYGRIYKFYNMKWVFMISLVIFEVGSAICGAAPTSGAFIAGRAIAGLASAGIFQGCMLIMIPMVPLHKRPMFQGMFGMIFGLSSVLGPLIGGGFTDGVTWRWCFYINLPIGAASMAFMLIYWNPPKRDLERAPVLTQIKRLDPIGFVLFVPSVVCLLLALQWGGSTYPWSSGRIIALFIVFGVLAMAFAAVQYFKPDTATIPPRVISQRSVLCATFYTFFVAGSMLLMVYYIPIWFQTVKGVSAVKSGIHTLPLVLSLAVMSLLSGLLTQKIGYYVPAMWLCPIIMAVGLGLMSTWTPSTGSSKWIAYQFLAGFGLGSGMQVGGLAMQTVLPPPDIPAGIAIVFFVQQLGGAIFTSVGQTILSNILVSRLSHIPGLDPNAVVSQGATDLSKSVPPQDIGLVIKAYNYACTRIFLAAMGVALVALVSALGMEWKNIKKGKKGMGGPGGPGGGPGGPAGGPPGPAGGPGGNLAPVDAKGHPLSSSSKSDNDMEELKLQQTRKEVTEDVV